MSANKIIFINQKGGVGKTTSCINVGSVLAKKGNKVLLVDLDSQGNLTSGVSSDSKLPGIYDLIAGKADLTAVQKTPVKNLSCLSGGINLAGLAVELVDEIGREYFLRDALKPLEDQYDYILIDCPPSLDLVTMNALAWAKYIIIPMQSEYYAMEGLNQLLKTINTVKKKLNPDLEVLGIVFTMVSKRSKLHKDVIDNVKKFFGELVFNSTIPRNVTLSEAPSHGLPINAYDNSCTGSRAYSDLTKEIIERVG